MDYEQGRLLAPRPPGPPPPPEAPQDENKKRKRAAVACKPCHQRKTACNSVRPVCGACEARETECFYLTKNESETKLQALKRENKSLNDLLKHLRTVPEDVAQSILLQLRTSENPLSVVKEIEAGSLALIRSSQTKAALAALPDVRSDTEFKLMVDHRTAYPAVNLTRDAILAKDTLLDPVKVLAHELPPDTPSRSPAVSSPSERTSVNDPGASFTAQDAPNAGVDRESQLIDPLLTELKIEFWTTIPVTNHFAASAISLYLENDHQTLGLFDAQLFLKDLVECRQEFCSSFLATALLAFACQAYTAKDPAAAEKSYQFEKEAELLWRAETKDSILTIAGLMLLYFSHGGHGSQASQKLSEFLQEAYDMAKRLKLFGVKHALDEVEIKSLSYEAQLALSHTTWGIFSLYTLQAQYYLCTATEYDPKLPIPHEQEVTGSDHQSASKSPTEMISQGQQGRQVFYYFCKLSVIASKILLVIRDTQGSKTPPPLAFAMAQFGELLELVDSLPQSMTRNAGACFAPVLDFYIAFHSIIMDLFRPFITSEKADNFRQFGQEEHNSPEAIFAASVHQLKAIIIEYTSQHPAAAHHLYWHTALLYVFNAVVKDQTNPHWQFYFWLCLDCYSKLYICFPVMEGIVQSLLAIAVKYGAMTKTNAVSAMQDRFYRDGAGKRARRRRGEPREGQRGTWMVDLDLAVRDRDAADVHTLIAKFEDMDMFDEFTRNLESSDSSDGGSDVLMGTEALG
ncbi:hypothetical protein BU23DRAFT_458985 [Bimuria novae-zelandiae CBS 107.79]|uniref:Zn(2)-C6 fungal-type domain-containing protein n=1 Tax=Bimuria novae-zelandiae CBS 107.79 TaxID=1447943 RepID=A0A6A5VDM2_9PLEO|nr:hypothetical protein BU23DRAFT_458985 [Bimuria novae-zelandiae CBS 107.79]